MNRRAGNFLSLTCCLRISTSLRNSFNAAWPARSIRVVRRPFLVGDAVIPEHVLPVIGLLGVLALGPTIKLALGGLPAGFSAAVAAQSAAGVRVKEDTPALTAPAHE